jgi:hypothetical protein
MTSIALTTVAHWRRQGLLQDKNRHMGNTRDKHTHTKQHTTSPNTPGQTITQLYQTNLAGENLERDDAERFGNALLPKKDKHFHVVRQNLRNLSHSAFSDKSRQLIDRLVWQETDALLMTKVGLYWPALKAMDQWQERTIHKLSHQKSVFAFNATEHLKTGWQQYGGVGICCTDQAVHRVTTTGCDPSKLGRWAWILATRKIRRDSENRHRLLSLQISGKLGFSLGTTLTTL